MCKKFQITISEPNKNRTAIFTADKFTFNGYIMRIEDRDCGDVAFMVEPDEVVEIKLIEWKYDWEDELC